jgi:hypothetical protein
MTEAYYDPVITDAMMDDLNAFGPGSISTAWGDDVTAGKVLDSADYNAQITPQMRGPGDNDSYYRLPDSYSDPSSLLPQLYAPDDNDSNYKLPSLGGQSSGPSSTWADSLKQMLEDLTELGWHEDQQIQIAQMANAPEAFAIMAVEKWIGEES